MKILAIRGKNLASLEGEFEITAFEEDITDTYFDCDYIVAGGQNDRR